MKSGLILEGGAMRSIFTAGAIDCLLDNAIRFDEVHTTSAGAYAALNYLSGQRGRCIETNVKTLESGDKYLGISTFFRTGGNLFDMDKLFDEYPNKKFPFDYKAFYNSSMRMVTSVTDCKRGEAVYFDEYGDRHNLMKIMRASNSLPFISKMVKHEGMDLVDGGMADPIPVFHAIECGVKKAVVVLTQTKNYRKKKTSKYGTLMRSFYWKYPKFRALLKHRPERYNAVLDYLEKEEAEGRIFVIRPKTKPVKNNETDTALLMDFYQHGYDLTKSRLAELKEFLTI